MPSIGITFVLAYDRYGCKSYLGHLKKILYATYHETTPFVKIK